MAKKVKDEEKTFQVASLENARKNKIDSISFDKKKSLANALAEIEKSLGKGSVIRLGDDKTEDMPHIPSGILSLDIALGIGGLPQGRIVELYGTESIGKSSLCLHFISKVQKEGGIAAYIDVEQSLDKVHAKMIGVNVDEMLVSQPSSAEDAFEIAESLIKSNSVNLIIIDSTSALVPRAELEGEFGQAQMGLQARLLSQALRKLTGVIASSNTTLIFISQIRSKIGGYGNPEVIGVGNALKFYASARIDLRKVEQLKKGDDVIGNRIKAKIVKLKVAPPFKIAEFNYYFNSGFDEEGSVIDVATELRIIERSGAWFAYGENRLGQGKENASQFLKDNPKITEEIKQKVFLEIKNKNSYKSIDTEVDEEK